jgi:hypothetical protein
MQLAKTISPQAAIGPPAGLGPGPMPMVSVPIPPVPHGPAFHLSTAVSGLSDDPTRKVINGLEVHEASFIGDVKASAQRRPRGRCWSCRAKTTYECKVCEPGPVPLCNRTARDCWWKYHAGEVTPYVPNKRGRKRKKDGMDDDDEDDDDDDDDCRKNGDVVGHVDADANAVEAAAAAAAAAAVVGNIGVQVPIVD